VEPSVIARRQARVSRSRPSLTRCTVAVAISVAALSACGHSQPSGLDATDTSHLLAFADAAAHGCHGKATHVQVARSTRDKATIATMGEIGSVGDHRPVWAMLITGDTYTCVTTGPSGSSPTQTTHDLVLIIDAKTFQGTDGGWSAHDTLSGLAPVITLR